MCSKKTLTKESQFWERNCDSTWKVVIRITAITSHEIHIYYLYSSASRRGKCLQKRPCEFLSIWFHWIFNISFLILQLIHLKKYEKYTLNRKEWDLILRVKCWIVLAPSRTVLKWREKLTLLKSTFHSNK